MLFSSSCRRFIIAMSCVLLLTMVFVVPAPVSARSTSRTPAMHTAVRHTISSSVPTSSNRLSRPKPYAGTGVKTPQRLGAGHPIHLPDIAHASKVPQDNGCSITIHGPDGRSQVTDTSVYPWRANAELEITLADGAIAGATAWFIGPHTLATAGHAVFVKNSGVPGRDGWVQSILVMPGRDGDNLPYGSAWATTLYSVVGWTQNGDENYDYGAIVIGSDLGNTVGWYGFGVFSDNFILSQQATISGYPCDKPSNTQWVGSDQFDSVTDRRLFYQTDTAGGDSGSAVYYTASDGPYGMGIHTTGSSQNSGGTRISDPVFTNLLNWRN